MQGIKLFALFFASVLASNIAYAQLPADAVWIDVRSPEEFAQGHLIDATLIPHDGIEAGIADLELDSDTPIYLYCRSGGRAGKAKERLEALGFSNVTNVGGLQDARALATESP
jgi:phage shock protein E